MKKLLNVLLFVFLGIFSVQAQILDPVEWSTEVQKVSDTEYILVSKATIDSGWHLYAQDVPEDGPVPTSFVYTNENKFTFEGKTKEDKGHVVDDPVFGMTIKYFEDEADSFEVWSKVQPCLINSSATCSVVSKSIWNV